ncbi:MAG: patatin-like phospholipase family protein [Candidatus Muiribacteriota bacterium]
MSIFKKKFHNYNLILGGGGSRGLSHIGILKYLQKAEFPFPHRITGCSMGSIIAALYAIYKNAETVEEKVSQIIESKDFKKIKIEKSVNIFSSYILLTILYRRKYLASVSRIKKVLVDFIPDDINIEQLDTKLEFSTFDIENGERILLKKGNLLEAVIASSAIPGIVETVKTGDDLLVDGGVAGSIPFFNYKDDKTKTIVVDVSYKPDNIKPLKNGLEIFYRSIEWQLYFFERLERDVNKNRKNVLVLEPDVKKYKLKDFYNYKNIIDSGYEYAQQKSLEIDDFLHKRFWQ